MKIRENIELKEKTAFRIGGRADYFVEVESKEEVIKAVEFAREKKLEIFVLAGGSNVLISDEGFRGLVIKIVNSGIIVRDNKIVCDAGLALSKLVYFSAEKDLTGLEWAAGIPGTVGGAIRGNAGAFGGEIKDSLEEVEILDLSDSELKTRKIKKDKLEFGYRESLIKRNKQLIILSAVFNLKTGDREVSKFLIAENIKKRTAKQPKGFSAGSFFKNPIVSDEKIIEKFEHDKEIKMRGDKLPVGWFIEDLGLKGKKIGGAEVSEKHANFIVNTGEARAEDVIILSSFLKQKVRDTFGIQLEEEVERVGF